MLTRLMAIHVALDHSTRYQYDRPVHLSPHVIRLFPAPHARTPIHDFRLDIEPANHRLYRQQDPFGNVVGRAIFPEPVTELAVHVRLVAEMTVINPFDFFVEEYAETFPFQYDASLRKELAPYFEINERGPHLTRWLAQESRKKQRIVDFLVGVNARLQSRIGYSVRLDPGIQTCEQTFETSIGSCRDSGWLLVQILRHMGLAARFVSGYLVQLTADEKSLDGPSGPEKDFTDLHAWAEVYVPGAGWIGLDATSGLFAGEGHIPLACTPDPVSAAPLTGFTDKCEVTFVHGNKVTRVLEDPRVTKPYTEEQWTEIRSLGRAVDREIKALDVRLTMGGEPTFVSIDDMEGAQWNTAALGTHKRERAGVLLARLKTAFAPGGFLQYGQGKWYPGEPLPRWALGCYWRGDGKPLWKDDCWLADESAQVQLRRRGRRALHQAAGRPIGHREQRAPRRLRGLALLPVAGGEDAARRQGRCRPLGLGRRSRAGGRPGTRPSRRLRLAVALELVRGRLALRALELRARHDVPDPGQLPDGSAAAVRSAAVGARVDA